MKIHNLSCLDLKEWWAHPNQFWCLSGQMLYPGAFTWDWQNQPHTLAKFSSRVAKPLLGNWSEVSVLWQTQCSQQKWLHGLGSSAKCGTSGCPFLLGQELKWGQHWFLRLSWAFHLPSGGWDSETESSCSFKKATHRPTFTFSKPAITSLHHK